jgi:hypothetical protein
MDDGYDFCWEARNKTEHASVISVGRDRIFHTPEKASHIGLLQPRCWYAVGSSKGALGFQHQHICLWNRGGRMSAILAYGAT